MTNISSNCFKQKIYACECKRCRAVVWLVEDKGAVLQFSPARAGRLCELAVVAAAGNLGLNEKDVVRERRAYAKHLGIELTGETSNAEWPAHINWALKNSNHNPNAKRRINLGSSKASQIKNSYFLK